MRLSIVMAYYRNPRMLHRHMLIWRNEWSAELKEQIEVVIVDDGSPEETAVDTLALMPDRSGLPPISLYRVTEDRLWHQHGARNLGAHVAQGDWLILTDMDHVIPADTLSFVLRLPKNKDFAYTFARRDAPANEPWRSDHWSTMTKTLNRHGQLKPHVNSFALLRETYWRAGGYDEDYCGIYGTDKLFRARLFNAAPHIHLSHYPLIRVGREVIPDASTRDVQRKNDRKIGAKKKIAEQKAARGEADVIKTLQFPWERVL